MVWKCAFCDNLAQHWVAAEIGSPIYFVCEECLPESVEWD